MLSTKNKDDIHLTYNASTVLSEFCENETFFHILTKPDVMRRIVNVATLMDAN
jgi:hypothetical protein